ncbi:MAG: shikimate kinase [Gorillibacterium sp.]|nr:shikimate kinase [Gorillibacterium sp.]
MNRNNLVLIGFMGTGKSTIGKLLARNLNWTYKDTDLEIEQAVGCSIPELFSSRGEALFREVESAALRRILAESQQVVATGGGCVLAEQNCLLMEKSGFVVSLNASVETIVSRVEGAKDRPLLAGNTREKVVELMHKRRGVYSFAHYHVDTDGLDPEEVADIIIQEFHRH